MTAIVVGPRPEGDAVARRMVTVGGKGGPVRRRARTGLAALSLVVGGIAAVATDASPAGAFPAVGLNFYGMGSTTTPGVVTGTPPDPIGAVGPNRYVQMVNGGVEIFDKSGAVVVAARPTKSLWAGYVGTNAGNGCSSRNDGEPYVRYDRIADRWVLSQISIPNSLSGPSFECVAVSKTPDPAGSYWFYDFVGANSGLAEEPKIGVWPDAYYTTYNTFDTSGNFTGAKVCAWDRAKMLLGQPVTQQCFQTSSSFYGMVPADLDGPRLPPSGSPEYLLAEDTVSANTLDFWKLHVDWANPANSTLTGPTFLTTAPFTDACAATPNGYCIPELGGGLLEGQGGRLMDRLPYRNFGDHEAMVVNHSVASGSTVGSRWYELRIANQSPSIFQQGTHAPADGLYRWMGSIAQDQAGDMALGFSRSGPSVNPVVAETGRLAGDPAGVMGQGESVVATGAGHETGPNLRWGDFTSMTVDPADDCTFWYTNEIYPTDGSTTWQTNIDSFKFPGCATPPPPTLTTSATPTVAVGGQISDAGTLSGGSFPTGTVTFKLYGSGDPSCAQAPIFQSTKPVNGDGIYPSDPFPTTTPGTYHWTASYSGDSVNGGVNASACGDSAETSTVLATPTIVTTASAPTTVGGSIFDTASLSAGSNPTGTITFKVFGPDDPTCTATPSTPTSTIPVTGNGTYPSGLFTESSPGTYRFVAAYSGDANNAAATTACNDPNEQTSVTQPAGRYTPLTPARILDTRNGTGGISGPVGPGASVDVQITGQGGVPASGVTAVAMNVTVTQPTGSGYLTLWPTGNPRPLAANLNFTSGETVPNLVVVKVGTGGKVSLFNSVGNSHVVFDVAGWYSDTPLGNDGRYSALVPARILDTRDGTGGGVRLGPGGSLDLQVSGAGGVPPTGAEAAVLNVAVTGTTAQSYLTVFPTGVTRPLAANLNFTGGDTVSNRVMAKLGAGGKVTIYNNAGSTDVVVDVGGWYSDASLVGTTGVYTPLVPARILDTRDGTGGIAGPIPGGTSVDVQVTGQGGVPASGVSAVILNATVTQPVGPGWLTISPTGATRPLASDLNYAPGETRPNLVVVRVGTGGKVNLFTQAGAHVVFDVAGWFS